jgi:hypothetical protein
VLDIGNGGNKGQQGVRVRNEASEEAAWVERVGRRGTALSGESPTRVNGVGTTGCARGWNSMSRRGDVRLLLPVRSGEVTDELGGTSLTAAQDMGMKTSNMFIQLYVAMFRSCPRTVGASPTGLGASKRPVNILSNGGRVMASRGSLGWAVW